MSKTGIPGIGDVISHRDWGAGKVIGLFRGGRVIRVEFDEMPHTPWDIPREELLLYESKTPPSSPSREEKEEKKVVSSKKKTIPEGGFPEVKTSLNPVIPVFSDVEDGSTVEGALKRKQDAITARQALEALRLGVVPTTHLDTYTVGRDVELAVVHKDLVAAGAGAGGVRVVLGDYGAGKTHFLEMAELMALREGFLATRVTLDSKEVPPARPRRIYHQLARGIRYPDGPDTEPLGLKPLLTKAAENDRLIGRLNDRKGKDYHPYLGPALYYGSVLSSLEQTGDLLEKLLDWIEGSEVAGNVELEKELRQATGGRVRLYALKDFRTVTHLYTLILGGIAEIARQVGYKGLAVMVDEAEFYSVLDGRDQGFADVLFRTFSAACLSPSVLHFDPKVLPRGGHAIHRSFSYRYKDEQPLYVVFALTHDPEGKAVLEKAIPGNRFMALPPFTTKDYITLSERVMSLYDLAQTPLALGVKLAALMAKVIEPCHRSGLIENPRQALKFITEVVDITRHRPGRLKPMLEDLLVYLTSGAP